jgi:hypothetical protein
MAPSMIPRPRRVGLLAPVGLGLGFCLCSRTLIGTAAAEPMRTVDDRGHVTDWTAGQLTARGLGVADRRAPSPASAREAARRRAIADATRKLVAAAEALPVAGDKARLAAKLPKEQLAALAAAEAIVLSSELLVDGSWRVEVALPLEALRQAMQGARPVPVKGDAAAAPAVVVVRAPAGTAPALGVAISDGKTALAPAILWTAATAEGAPLSERVLAQAPALTASKDGAGLRVPKLAGASDATLFVVVIGK